jgi:uncharacterized MAPEG superfamily protein
MTFPLWSLLIASLFPIVTAWVCGYFRNKQFGVVDNKHPRDQYARLTGAGARAVAAQQNAWEALAIYAPAVLVTHFLGVTGENVTIACAVFIVARALYLVAYLANKDILRSLLFIIGLGASISLYIMAA